MPGNGSTGLGEHSQARVTGCHPNSSVLAGGFNTDPSSAKRVKGPFKGQQILKKQ